ncbi:MAG: phosphotransferase family protein [Novosphingobium sp.]
MTPDSARLVTALDRSLVEGVSFTQEPAEQVTLTQAGRIARLLGHASRRQAHHDRDMQGRALLDRGAALLAQPAAHDLPPAPRPEQRFEVAEAVRERIAHRLDRMMQALAECEGQAVTEWRDAVFDWECETLDSLAAPVDSALSHEKPIRFDCDTLQSYFRRTVAGGENIVVTSARRLSGGYGRATVLIEFAEPVLGECELVMRAQLPDAVVVFDGIDIQAEYQVFSLAHAAGIPAPEPFILETGDNETGTKFIVVRKMPGSNYGSVFEATHDLSDQLIHNIVETLANIHRISLSDHHGIVNACHLAEWARDRTATDSIRRWLDMWQIFHDELDYPSPLLARGFRWLYDNIPQVDAPPSLMHSDYALGNVLIENDRISGVLDWEQTHLGDPAEEVSWLATNLRSKVTEETLVRIYGDITGDYVSQERLRFFDVFTAVKIMLCGVSAAAKFQAKDTLDGLFCELASFTMAPYARLIHETIERAEVVKKQRSPA